LALKTHPKKTSSTLEAGTPDLLMAAELHRISKENTFNRMDTEVDGCERRQRALKGTDGSTGDSCDIDFGHFEQERVTGKEKRVEL
jgi:hypothetical protein